jgi:type III restriction enzyme
LRNPVDWGVTGATQRLLEHWRHHEFSGPQPFFCQIEAVETMTWLTEVAPKRAASKGLLDQLAKANAEANPELFRVAMKMATGSGKTTVMAMPATSASVFSSIPIHGRASASMCAADRTR